MYAGIALAILLPICLYLAARLDRAARKREARRNRILKAAQKKKAA